MFTDELRIGNWVQRIGFPLKVTGIKGSDVWVDGNGVELEYYIYDGINPIPLTEEWLVKFGFKFSNDFQWWYKGEHNLTLDLGGQDTYECMCYPIKYVHQLQNLYKALTEDEL